MTELWVSLVAFLELCAIVAAFPFGRSYQISQDTKEIIRKMKER